MANLLELPTDVILQILDSFGSVRVIKNRGLYNTFQNEWEELGTLQACRLTCRALNELASNMVCPIFRGGLNKHTMERITHLSQNPSIAKGIRAVEINLAFRPKPIAEDISRYYTFVAARLNAYSRSCSYYTEFGDYDEDDLSPDAIRHRALLAAYEKFDRISESWRLASNSRAQPRGRLHADASYQQLLMRCFDIYRQRQQEEEQIINDGSFVRTIAEAMSRLQQPGFLSFVDSPIWARGRQDEVVMAENKELLSQEMLEPHEWLTVERDETSGEISPARILMELPIACDGLEKPLRGLHIGCFPLTRSFTSLLSPSYSIDPSRAWSELSSACRHLECFQLGKRELATVDLFMTPFRTCGHKEIFSRSPQPADLYYQAGTILYSLGSLSSLKNITIHNVELSHLELELLLEKLPSFGLRHISLTGIHLNSGGFAHAVEILKTRVQASEGCTMYLSSFAGGEFGPPKGFDDSGWMSGGDKFWDDLKKHQQPQLLVQVEAYVSGEESANPLLKETVVR